jgi:glucans biosynthesis protein
MQLFAAQRCGARTPSGARCRAPAIRGKQRCRMHGGKNPGVPKGNRNPMKHGGYTSASIQQKRDLRDIMRKHND